jgi:hypothetical protein
MLDFLQAREQIREAIFFIYRKHTTNQICHLAFEMFVILIIKNATVVQTQ